MRSPLPVWRGANDDIFALSLALFQGNARQSLKGFSGIAVDKLTEGVGGDHILEVVGRALQVDCLCLPDHGAFDHELLQIHGFLIVQVDHREMGCGCRLQVDGLA